MHPSRSSVMEMTVATEDPVPVPARPNPPVADRPATTRTRLPALDAIRFLCALSVAVFHLVAVAGAGQHVDIWGRPSSEVFGRAYVAASYGWVGVPLFFIVSGFVICMTSWGRGPAEYGMSRFVRLFPAFWVCVISTTVVATLHPAVFRPLHFRALMANLTMLQDPLGVPRVDDAYWTLWLELKFYLLFLIVVRVGLSYRRVVGFCVIWGIASVWVSELKQPWLNAIVMPGNAQYFIAGIAFYLVYRYGSHLVPWLIVGFSWLLSMHFYVGNPWQARHGQSYTPASVMITLCYVLMILLVLGRLNWLRWRGLTTLGATTYPLYLLHYVIGFTAIHYLRPRLNLPPAVLLVGVLAALTGFAWLVHRLIERPVAARLRAALIRPPVRRTDPGRPAPSRPAPSPQSFRHADCDHRDGPAMKQTSDRVARANSGVPGRSPARRTLRHRAVDTTRRRRARHDRLASSAPVARHATS